MFRVNDIFYSLQGEGRNTGRAAVFIRFAGCNLRCPFCDTDFDAYREMTDADILSAIAAYPSRFIVLTGGEPTLQVDEAFVDLLHQHGYEVAMESNGTRPAPHNLDWLTVSPKSFSRSEGRGARKEEGGTRSEVRTADEIKIVFDENTDVDSILAPRSSFLLPRPSLLPPRKTPLLYLQPCDTGDPQRNARIVAACVAYIKQHPQWRLSLQTHKLIDIP
ncbi:MAG: radical SAM protein [Prevotella sp.]|nr:radical SAM protein [Prevotella sp.]